MALLLLRRVGLLLLLSLLPLEAQHIGVASDGVRFAFAVPDHPTVVALGVYDADGNLIRRLAEGKPEVEFQAGLNGLLAFWDGRLDNGELAPKGVYSLKGYAVESPVVTGEEFRGNAWAVRFGSNLALQELLHYAALPTGDLVGLGRRGEELILFRLDLDGSVRWTQSVDVGVEPRQVVVGEGDSGLLLGGGQSKLFALDDGSLGEQVDIPAGALVGLDGSRVIIALDSKLQILGLPQAQPIAELALDFRPASLSVSDQGWLMLDPAGHPWSGNQAELRKLPFDQFAFRFAQWGQDQTFWALLSEEDQAPDILGQFSIDGEFLRRIVTTEHGVDLEPLSFSAATQAEVVYLELRSETGPPGFRGLKLNPASGTWEFFLDIAPGAGLALAVNREPEGWLEIEFDDEMTGRRGRMLIRPELDEEGRLWLVDAGGLRLVHLLQNPAFRSAGLRPAGNGWILDAITDHWSERYAMTGLRRLALIDAGEVEWGMNP